MGIGDGALGFWGALAEAYPDCKWQRCWVHKTANVLDKLPKQLQGKAKGMLHDIYLSEVVKVPIKHLTYSFIPLRGNIQIHLKKYYDRRED